ncbi:RseA family anti-sigma factor [Candidatus Fukatsuia symbiotica]|uniref:Anti-sigma-E factor RseA n=1 Tax=Candidatus Fukatsuia symbiotica TaxID=1878942 RepID=A0A2U8I9U1_9GAMM|nr:RseA family anti-sigma factor [Candidatus Fukatsuia symbiotica]AWK14805.1 hypothetical protein CCS41_10510 [Candidatus Fukatsuia symbiotica]MEA9445142.1 RseA family anti-sigma factor [Candidatus Fukatsuia symbiotica]
MQKEKLSALMDGEILDTKLIDSLLKDDELQQRWQRYHMIRGVLRRDQAVGAMLHIDIAHSVAQVIKIVDAQEGEKATVVPLNPAGVPEHQPRPSGWHWQKVCPWASQLTQVAVAACVCLAVVVGVQQYSQQRNQPAMLNLQPESPVFNTLPMMGGKASPVSFGVPVDGTFGDSQQQQVQKQRKRVEQGFGLDQHIPFVRLEPLPTSVHAPDTQLATQ